MTLNYNNNNNIDNNNKCKIMSSIVLCEPYMCIYEHLKNIAFKNRMMITFSDSLVSVDIDFLQMHKKYQNL